jgi:hypothetical protein
MGKMLSGLFGGGDKPQPAPVVEPPAPTPMEDTASIEKKKKEAIARKQQRGGRQSTLLSQAESDTLG